MNLSRRALAPVACLVAAASVLLFAGCGGGGGGSGGSSPPPPPPPVQGAINGTAVKGPVSDGTVTAYAISNGMMGSQIASAKTDAQGNFSLAIGTYTGPVMLQMSGGSYTDEATGTTMPMMSGDVMMMSDASDGMMDGKSGSAQISMGGGMMMGSMMQPTAGTSGLATAMTTFLWSSANTSGLNATMMNALIQKLSASNGQL